MNLQFSLYNQTKSLAIYSNQAVLYGQLIGHYNSHNFGMVNYIWLSYCKLHLCFPNKPHIFDEVLNLESTGVQLLNQSLFHIYFWPHQKLVDYNLITANAVELHCSVVGSFVNPVGMDQLLFAWLLICIALQTACYCLLICFFKDPVF